MATVDPVLGHRMDPRQKECLDCGAKKWDIIYQQLECPNSTKASGESRDSGLTPTGKGPQ